MAPPAERRIQDGGLVEASIVEQPEDPLPAYTRWSLRRRLNKKKTFCLIQAMLKKYTTFVKDIFNNFFFLAVLFAIFFAIRKIGKFFY